MAGLLTCYSPALRIRGTHWNAGLPAAGGFPEGSAAN